MARRLDDMGGDVADMDDVAFVQLRIERTDARGLLGRSDDPQLGKARLQSGNALGVVGVMVGDQEIGQLPAIGRRRGDDGVGVGRIDRRGGAWSRRSWIRTPKLSCRHMN